MNTELSPRSRAIGVVVWCSFLTAGGGTMVLFAFLDPAVLWLGDSRWSISRHAAYALGFFFFWLVTACSAALTIYMARTERPAPAGER